MTNSSFSQKINHYRKMEHEHRNLCKLTGSRRQYKIMNTYMTKQVQELLC